MSISFTGINEQVLTFKTSAQLEPGTLVKINENATVTPCENGDEFIGTVLFCRDSLAAVQVSGFVQLPYSGTAPTLSYTKLCAASATQVKEDGAAGRELLVIETDSADTTVGFML